MQITIVSAGKIIPASELISATLRTDLAPIPASIEFGAGTLLSPKTFANKAAFFTPVFIGNYSGKAGEVDLDFIDIEDADNIADFENFKTTYTTDVEHMLVHYKLWFLFTAKMLSSLNHKLI